MKLKLQEIILISELIIVFAQRVGFFPGNVAQDRAMHDSAEQRLLGRLIVQTVDTFTVLRARKLSFFVVLR